MTLHKINKQDNQVNPFVPAYGSLPPIPVGREKTIEEIVHRIQNSKGSIFRSILFYGQRGIGKTVMLSEIAQKLNKSKKWLCLNVHSNNKMLERIENLVERARKEVVSLSISGASISFKNKEVDFTTWLEESVKNINKKGKGVFISVDEVHHDNSALRELCSAVQICFNSNIDIAVAFAGLPESIDGLLKDNKFNKNITFIRRSKKYLLDYLPVSEIAKSYIDIFGSRGIEISEAVANMAAEATFGYSYMVQLVGYYMWENIDNNSIDANRTLAAIETSIEDLEETVYDSSLGDLSSGDLELLYAIASEGEIVDVQVLISSLDKSPQYVNNYLNRLKDAGFVNRVKRGKVKITTPYMRQFLIKKLEREKFWF
ncbi:MAG: AAA family ATPase [Candidatus Ancillula sp.]|jgi:predicted transcriptional regulator|nr:AAA family ATPase [Candidatus Ancillula sp.]